MISPALTCLNCGKPATAHVVIATEAHGVISEEHWCDEHYVEES